MILLVICRMFSYHVASRAAWWQSAGTLHPVKRIKAFATFQVFLIGLAVKLARPGWTCSACLMFTQSEEGGPSKTLARYRYHIDWTLPVLLHHGRSGSGYLGLLIGTSVSNSYLRVLVGLVRATNSLAKIIRSLDNPSLLRYMRRPRNVLYAR
ncbi:uncharacterized protein LAESUDRAFT_50021 [Laetiporus sulphureus 93-53]|uniref:Uncharacterized protein n=1 Tax=Laetiporus sulphureus 93-53 TaxID=1314785 RepID=A0A165FAY0_9APHY|nr:uncharacterized protein LAESUDRAFT_50021 [Laetiporus sulphureus 93-53]KZT08690.1 hypothetical protein LAESUDRAFT_50021 [Laetiporus sulphureus 93-53]